MYLLIPIALACTSPLEDPEMATEPPSETLPPTTPRTPAPALPSPNSATEEGPAQSLSVHLGDQEMIASTVREYKDEVQTCVEHALRRNPILRGRVSFGWSIQNGAVSSAHLVTDTVRDPELQSCLLRVINRMKFDPSITAEVAEFPWLIEPPAPVAPR